MGRSSLLGVGGHAGVITCIATVGVTATATLPRRSGHRRAVVAAGLLIMWHCDGLGSRLHDLINAPLQPAGAVQMNRMDPTTER